MENEQSELVEGGGADGAQGWPQESSEGIGSDESSRKEEDSVGGRQGALGFVYFIETADGRFVKIGFSRQVIKRMSQLGTLRPTGYELKVVACFPATLNTERWLHRKFESCRDNGEWFRNTDEIRAFVQTVGLEPEAVVPKKRRGRPAKPRPQESLTVHMPQSLRVQAAAELGRAGGLARALVLDPETRSEIAKKAADARWGAAAMVAARILKISPERRTEIARKAANARWARVQSLNGGNSGADKG